MTGAMDLVKSHLLPDGMSLRYRLWEPAHARGLVVLLHGLASNQTRWSEFVEHTALKQNWKLLRPDLRGHGESFSRSSLSMEAWVADLAELLDAERADTAVLIGHSLGAHVALRFTARYPARVRGLVLIDPAFPEALRGSLRAFRRLAPLVRVLVSIIRLLNTLGFRRRHIPLRDLRQLDETVRAELLEHGRSEDFVRRYSSVYADLKYFPTAHYLKEAIEMTRKLPAPGALGIPVLVLLSKGLTYTDPDRTRALLDGAERVDVETIEAYHWPLTENPEQVRATIERWFARRFGAPQQTTSV